jgi:hypothetical protein
MGNHIEPFQISIDDIKLIYEKDQSKKPISNYWNCYFFYDKSGNVVLVEIVPKL